jgi:hypothetical protein
VLTLSVNDQGNTGGGALSGSDTATINITAVNDAPVLSIALVDQGATVGTPLTYTVPAGSFTDVDTSSLTYSATLADGSPLPGWLTFVPGTRTFSGTPPGGFTLIDVKVTASDGTLSANDTFRITAGAVDTTPPAAPVITTATDNVGTITGTVASGGVTDDTVLVLSGTAEPNSTVTLYDGTTLLGTAAVNGAGAWTFTTATLSNATHNFTATATDGAGNTGGSSATYSATVDTVAPAAPTVSTLTTNDPTPTISGTWDNSTGHTLTSVVVNGVTYTVGTDLTVSGGTWTLTIPAGNTLPDGSYNVAVTTRDAAGNTSTDATGNELVIDTVPPAPTLNLAPNITADDIINIAESGGMVAITGTAGGDAKVGDVVTLTVNGTNYTGTVQAGGTFSINVPGAQLRDDPDATIAASVSTTDSAGNTGTATGTVTYTVDVTAPGQPTVNTLSTSSTQPTLTGTYDAAGTSTFTVSVNGTVYTLGTSPALSVAGNTWSLDLAVSGQTLIAGSNYDVLASASDVAGNSIADTGSGEVTIAGTGPTTPFSPPGMPGTPGGPGTGGGTGSGLSNPGSPSSSTGGGTPGAGTDASTPASNLNGGSGGTPGAGTPGSSETQGSSSVANLLNSLPATAAGTPNETQGFAIPVVGGSAGDAQGTLGSGSSEIRGDDQIFVHRGVLEPRTRTDGSFDFDLPKDAFAHTNPSAIVRLEATLADGSPLPSWLTFNTANGGFTGTPPTPAAADVEVKVTARDDAGREAAIVFTPIFVTAPNVDTAASGAGDAGKSIVDRTGLGTGIPGLEGSLGSGSGFPLARVSLSDPRVSATLELGSLDKGGHRLFVFAASDNLQLAFGSKGFAQVPSDAFAHTDPNAIVVLEARLASGAPLPSWLSFDGVKGVFSGVPPAGSGDMLEIEIVARDTEGRLARAVFTLVLSDAQLTERATIDESGAELGMDVDKDEKEKARREAAEAERQAGQKDAQKARLGPDGKPLKQGATTFSDQLKAAKGARDPLLDRIAKAETPRVRPGR